MCLFQCPIIIDYGSYNSMSEVLTPLERALRQQSEKLAESFLIIGPPVSNIFFPDSRQLVLYTYPPKLSVSETVISFLKSPTPFMRMSKKKYFDVDRMDSAVTILPGSDLSQYAVIVSHLEPVCMHSSLINGPIEIPSTISSFNVVRRFYIFICLQPHVRGLVETLKFFIRFDFESKLKMMLENKTSADDGTSKAILEDILRSVLESQSPRLFFDPLQIPNSFTDYKGYTLIVSYHKCQKSTEVCHHPLMIRYTSMYPLPNMMLLSDFAFPTFFTLLPVSIILDIFEAALLETSVIFTSTRPKYSTACCFGLLSLLHPLSWQGVFLPIVPHSHKELLEAPVPGIYGTQPLKRNPSNSGLLVNTDSFLSVTTEKKKAPPPTELPSSNTVLPKDLRKSLQQAMEGVVMKYRDDMDENICMFTTEMLTTLWELFYKHVFGLLVGLQEPDFERLRKAIIASPSIDTEMSQFLLQFIQTQHFNSWWFSQFIPYSEKISKSVL